MMMAVRKIYNYWSLHFTFYSMKLNEVMLISDLFTRDAALKTSWLKIADNVMDLLSHLIRLGEFDIPTYWFL